MRLLLILLVLLCLVGVSATAYAGCSCGSSCPIERWQSQPSDEHGRWIKKEEIKTTVAYKSDRRPVCRIASAAVRGIACVGACVRNTVAAICESRPVRSTLARAGRLLTRRK